MTPIPIHEQHMTPIHELHEVTLMNQLFLVNKNIHYDRYRLIHKQMTLTNRFFLMNPIIQNQWSPIHEQITHLNHVFLMDNSKRLCYHLNLSEEFF